MRKNNIQPRPQYNAKVSEIRPKMEVADRLGMEKEEAAKKILNIEDREHGRAA
jgi:hypothetical protein